MEPQIIGLEETLKKYLIWLPAMKEGKAGKFPLTGENENPDEVTG